MVFWGTEFYHFLLPNTVVSVWTCPPHKHWSQGLLSLTPPSLLSLFNNVRFLDEMLFYIWKELLSAVTASSAWLLVALFCTSRWVIIRRGWLSLVLIWYESWIERKRVNQHKELILHWLATDKLPAHWIGWNSCPVTIAIIAHSVLLLWITRNGYYNLVVANDLFSGCRSVSIKGILKLPRSLPRHFYKVKKCFTLSELYIQHWSSVQHIWTMLYFSWVGPRSSSLWHICSLFMNLIYVMTE